MRSNCRPLLVVGLLFVGGALAQAADIDVTLRSEETRASLSVNIETKHRIRINVAPSDISDTPLVLLVSLPATGPDAWPLDRVHVLDEQESPLPMVRDGLRWETIEVEIPAERASYYVEAAPPSDFARPKRVFRNEERTAKDEDSGLTTTLCRWYDGREAALSIRFDDSHPSHLDKAVPILAAHDLRATFMINPGKAYYRERQDDWESLARKGTHEFGNHTLNHSGATNDDAMEREIGEVSTYLWRLFSDKSKVAALNLGGTTKWQTTRPFRYYLDTYFLFPVSGSLGMDDAYGARAKRLEAHIASHIKRELWCRAHFHSIGPRQSTTEENFRAALRVADAHRDRLWIAGLADVYKYDVARSASRISLARLSDRKYEITVTCESDPDLFDHDLSVSMQLPADASIDSVRVTAKEGTEIPTSKAGATEMLFHVPPVTATYRITL